MLEINDNLVIAVVGIVAFFIGIYVLIAQIKLKKAQSEKNIKTTALDKVLTGMVIWVVLGCLLWFYEAIVAIFKMI